MNSVFNKSNFLILFILSLTIGCVKELVPKNNGYQPKVAVWAILNLDSSISVITSGNRGLEDKNIVNIPSINMFLYEDDRAVDSLITEAISSESKTHRFKFKPSFSKNYTLKIVNLTVEINSSILMPNPLLKPNEIKLTQGDNAQLLYTTTDDVTMSDAYQFDVEICHYGILKDTATNKVLDSFYLFINQEI